MPLWTPKDSSRPLWTQGRRTPKCTRRRLPPPSCAVDYHRNSKGRGRGYHQRVRQVPGGGLPPGDGCGGGVGLGLAPRGVGRKYQVTLRPHSPSPCRIERLVSAGGGYNAGGWRHVTGQQLTPLRALPLAPDSGFPWRPLYTNGVEQLGDDPTLPLRSADFRHVALSETFEDGWLSDPDPISDVSQEGDTEQAREHFPYLQLHPPHCSSCTC